MPNNISVLVTRDTGNEYWLVTSGSIVHIVLLLMKTIEAVLDSSEERTLSRLAEMEEDYQSLGRVDAWLA